MGPRTWNVPWAPQLGDPVLDLWKGITLFYSILANLFLPKTIKRIIDVFHISKIFFKASIHDSISRVAVKQVKITNRP